MRYNDKIEKTEEMMNYVINSIENLSEDRFIASLYIRNCSPIDVDIRLAEVRQCLGFVHKESLCLAKLELTYNKDFAVLDNKRFTTAQSLFNRLRSTMACLRKTLRRTCPRIHKKPFNPNFKPSIFEESVLTKGCCARDLYDITSFDDNVQALYYEQQSLFANTILSLAICYRVIKEENEIRNDPDKALECFHDQCQRMLEDMNDTFDVTKDIPESEIQRKIDELGIRNYAGTYFHKESVSEVKQYVKSHTKRAFLAKERIQQLSLLFPDEQKRDNVLMLIDHFDEIMPCNRRKMDALKIHLFCNWCKGGKHDNPKQNYYQTLLKVYTGKHTEFPDWHAITTCKNRKSIDIMKEQQKFNQEVDLLLERLKKPQKAAV